MSTAKEPLNLAVKEPGKSVGVFVEVDGIRMPKAEYDAQQAANKTAKTTQKSNKGV